MQSEQIYPRFFSSCPSKGTIFMNARLLRRPEGEQARCISAKLYGEEAQCFESV